MRQNSTARLFFLFLAAWLFLNFLQAALTELDPDEAYYWMYSQQLDWGYFDHPPMIALLINWGRQLLPGHLGVRLFPLLLPLLSFYLMWKMLDLEADQKGTRLLIALLIAMPFINVFSFIATPDAPLLFFATLYLYLHRRFLERSDFWTTFLLGTTMAALLYSKYHGVLWILLILLSHWRVLLRPQFYMASIWGFLLFFPHLYWQYTNEFPSFRYHLSGRNDRYELRYTTTYLLNQLIVFSPFLIGFLGLALWRFRPQTAFERSWKYLVIGFLLLFLGLTAKGHAEPQWTALAVLPAIMILHRSASQGLISRFWLIRAAWLSFVVLLVARVLIVLPQNRVDSDFHKKHRAFIMADYADGLPVLYMDTYRAPSKYAFYTGNSVHSLTDVYYRKNQYDLWDWAKAFHNQRILVNAQKGIDCDFCEPLRMEGEVKGTLIRADSFQVTQNAWIEMIEVPDTLFFGESRTVELSVENPYEHTIHSNTGTLPVQIVAILTDQNDYIQWYSVALSWESLPGNKTSILKGTLSIPDYGGESGTVQLNFGFKTGVLFPAYNSTSKSVFLADTN